MHALGLQTAQGLIMTEAWYWDLNDANREFAKKFAPQYKGIHPTMVHAGVYSAVTHYLKAVEALKSDADGKAVVAKMKELPTDDKLFGKGTVRADGRKIHPMYLFEVKKPAESKGPWDYYKLRATIPADQAFRPLADGGCPLVKSWLIQPTELLVRRMGYRTGDGFGRSLSRWERVGVRGFGPSIGHDPPHPSPLPVGEREPTEPAATWCHELDRSGDACSRFSASARRPCSGNC